MKEISKLNSFFYDSEIEDIILKDNGVFTYKKGKWSGPFLKSYCSTTRLFSMARKIAELNETSIGLTKPSLDAYLKTNSEKNQANFRAHIVIPPMTALSPEITLRRLPAKKNLIFDDFNLSQEHKKILKEALLARKNILVSGATGSGKTSFLTTLLDLIPENERVVLLEDSAELEVPNTCSTKLLANRNRFGFQEGAEWNLEDLVYESLRMRPDRIVLGECRGPEAKALAQALITGHSGVMTSLHAGNCDEALKRFHDLLSDKKNSISFQDLKKLWHIVIHLKENSEGKREVSELSCL